MPYVDTNSHLTKKLHNFDIKCHSNSDSYDRRKKNWDQFRGGQNLQWEVFPTRESALGLTGWALSY